MCDSLAPRVGRGLTEETVVNLNQKRSAKGRVCGPLIRGVIYGV
jgi:hypothetical protein